MFSAHRCKWFVLGLCLSTSLGCASTPCASCKGNSPPPPRTGCNNCTASTNGTMHVVADPAGAPGTYFLIPSTDVRPAPNFLVKQVPNTLPPVGAQPKDMAILPPTKLELARTGESTVVTKTLKFPPLPPAPKNAEPVAPAVVSTTARYDHANDYRWVMGKLEYLYSKKVWRVRYAPAEVEDELGGSVTLLGADPVASNLKDGQMVRVDGVLVDPDSKQISPNYQVHAIKPMD